MIEVIPGILTDSFEDVQGKLKKLEGLCNLVHIDVADGRFVPNLTIQADEIAKLETKLAFNLHLMIFTENNQIFPFLKTKAVGVIFYPKTTKNPESVISIIKTQDKMVGISLDPDDQVANYNSLFSQVDFVLVLGVKSGFTGQKFIPQVLSKIFQIKEIQPNLSVGVDGGITPETARMAATAGADFVVSSSFIWESESPAAAIEILKKEVQI